MPVNNKYKVLLIDDDSWIHRILPQHLHRMGFETISCLDPVESISIILREKPNIIILDIIMPEISGSTLLKIIKSIDDIASIPVIIISSALSREVITGFLEKGVIGFISKPFTNETIFEKMYSLVEGKMKSAMDEYAKVYIKKSPQREFDVPNSTEITITKDKPKNFMLK